MAEQCYHLEPGDKKVLDGSSRVECDAGQIIVIVDHCNAKSNNLKSNKKLII